MKKNSSKAKIIGTALATVACLGAVAGTALTADRASADNASQAVTPYAETTVPDISGISGLYFHLDAQSETSVLSGKVSRITNHGSGGDAVQPDSSRQPSYVASSDINGMPAYRFSATSYMAVENSADKYVTDMTVFMVANASILPAHGEIFSRTPGAPFDHNWFFNIENGQLNYGWCVRSESGSLTYPKANVKFNTGSSVIIGGKKDGTKGEVYYNGETAVQFIGGPEPCNHANTPVMLGGVNDSFIGDIGELLFFDRALTAGECTLVEQYLESRWNMTDLHDGMLADIKIGGKSLGGFRFDKTDYFHTTDTQITTADVSYTTWNTADTATITKTLGGFAIEVTSASTGKKTTYSIGVKMRNYNYNEIKKFTANEVKLNNGFWSSLYRQYSVYTVNFMFDMFELTKSFDNFDRVAAGERKTLGNTSEHAAQILSPIDDKNVYNTEWRWVNEPWREGLIYEGIRAASQFIIVNKSDPSYSRDVKLLKDRLDGYVARIYAAALKTTATDGRGKPIDGYFSTFNILDQSYAVDEAESSARWHHDIYNYGCLVEAAIYHYNATGDTRLLFAATRFTEFFIDYINGRDGYQGYKVVPPHELPEEALQRLYDMYNDDPSLVTLMQDRYSHAQGLSNKDRYYKLTIRLDEYKKIAASWITDRGNSEGRYNYTNYGAYAQDNTVYTELTDATGHAVRANLWYNGIAYIGNRQENDDFVAAAQRVWHNIVGSQMYITGGTGSTNDGEEAYGGSNELPHNGYCETCASVGMAFFGQNMFYLFGDAEYADVVELEMYNGILGCLGLDGNSFYYTNPMVSNHYLRPMFSNATPCCVPMYLKFFAELPEMIYAQTADKLFVNQYVSSSLQANLGGAVSIIQDTDMPTGDRASFSVRAANGFTLKLRMPSWASGAKLTVNGKQQNAVVGSDGYIDVAVSGNADISVAFVKEVIRVTQDNAKANANKVALRYGPFIYCAESCDNGDIMSGIVITEDVTVTIIYNATEFEYRTADGDFVPVGVNILTVTGASGRHDPLKLIPFYLRGNRDDGYMTVWFDRT